MVTLKNHAKSKKMGQAGKPETLPLEESVRAQNILDISREDILRRRGVHVPFPLESIYYWASDDINEPTGVYSQHAPEYLGRLSFAAYGAINDYRMFFFKPGLTLNKEQLKMAVEVALEIRGEYPDLPEIPLPRIPDDPCDEDFIRIGQWFLDTHTAIKKDSNDTKIINEARNITRKGRNKRGRKTDQKIITRNHQIALFKAHHPRMTYKQIGAHFDVSAEVVRKACNNPEK